MKDARAREEVRAGEPSARCCDVLAHSPEAAGTLRATFQTELGRPAAEAEVAWMQDIMSRSGSQAEVRVALAATPEVDGDIRDLYRRTLNREADADGLTWAKSLLAGGASQDGVRVTLASSPEATLEVASVFQDVQGRSASPSATAWMQAQLATGDSISDVRTRLADSAQVLNETTRIRLGQGWDASTERIRSGFFQEPSGNPNADRVFSPFGQTFLYTLEARRGVSEHTHHPPGASGVTIGPGYDMRDRTPQEVVTDLTAVGMDPAKAQILALGVGLTGAEATALAKAHAGDVSLTDAQQVALLDKVVQPYQKAVQYLVKVPLNQNQFDALVSYTYNAGIGGLRNSKVLQLVNSGQFDKVPDELRRDNQDFLVGRRNIEAALFGLPP